MRWLSRSDKSANLESSLLTFSSRTKNSAKKIISDIANHCVYEHGLFWFDCSKKWEKIYFTQLDEMAAS